MHEAENPILFPTDFLGFDNWINPLTVSWLAFLLVGLLLWAAKRNMQPVPRGAQNFVEMVIEFVENMSNPLVGPHAPFFFPLFFTLFLFIFFADLMGLIPGLVSPTSRVDVNLAMALIVFLSSQYFGVKEKGLHYFAHFLPPKIPMNSPNLFLNILMGVIYAGLCVLMPLIHLIGELVKPVSLTMRLFGNMMAKEKLLAVLVLLISVFWGMPGGIKALSAFPFILRILIVVLGVFVCFVQAFVFMLLAMVYIGAAVHEGHEMEEGEAGGQAAA